MTMHKTPNKTSRHGAPGQNGIEVETPMGQGSVFTIVLQRCGVNGTAPGITQLRGLISATSLRDQNVAQLVAEVIGAQFAAIGVLESDGRVLMAAARICEGGFIPSSQ